MSLFYMNPTTCHSKKGKTIDTEKRSLVAIICGGGGSEQGSRGDAQGLLGQWDCAAWTVMKDP